MNGFLRWTLPLFALAGTIYAVWLLWFHRHLSTPRTDGQLLACVGLAYLIAIGFLLFFTRRWTMRALGQIATYGADAALYLGVGASALGWWPPYSRDELNLIRSGFVVGSACLVVGLFAWAIQRRRAGRLEVSDA
jgi:hypothetical protein